MKFEKDFPQANVKSRLSKLVSVKLTLKQMEWLRATLKAHLHHVRGNKEDVKIYITELCINPQ